MGDYIFNLPGTSESEEKRYPKTPLFDFEKGEFVTDGNGAIKEGGQQEAWLTWCRKALNIERLTKLSYSRNLGIETKPLALYPEREAKESWLRRTIEETLLSDPLGRTKRIESITFTYPEADSIEGTVVFSGVSGMRGEIKMRFENG